MPSAWAFAGSWAARRRGRCCITPPGSATRRWRGRLLERGADPLAAAPQPGDTPLAWAAHGSQYWELPGRDYVAVGELLVAAGAPVEPRHVEVAEGPLYGWLEGRLDELRA